MSRTASSGHSRMARWISSGPAGQVSTFPISSMRPGSTPLQMWIALDNHRQKQAAEEVARLRTDLQGMQTHLDARPERIVEKYIDASVLDEARATADRAFSSRERAWRKLLEVRLLHNEIGNRRCRCGRPHDHCETAQLLGGYSALNR